MKTKFKLIATAAAGLEAVVGREIRNLGLECQVENGRVRFEGTVETIIETNLWLRAADRIKIVVGNFPAKTFEELFQGIFALDWENYLPLGAKFPIAKAKCVKSKLHNEPSVQAISKKAVVKKLQKHYARPEGVPLMENGAEFKIEVSILKDVATVLIDTTGSSLFKRGYRTEKGGAPIKENMAAAILLLSNWYPDKPLIDPTCGSGTFCIEAAMIGNNDTIYLVGVQILQTGGLALGDIIARSKFFELANSFASLEVTIPNCSPVSEINLTSLTLISSLIAISLLILEHLYFLKNKISHWKSL